MGDFRAVLGPTNTGKTHLAVERMLAHETGMIGLPLRLLAREIYDRIVAQKGEAAAALVTGEERIIPPTARYYACTVEAMPMSVETAFLAIDEAQLSADPDRGHVFTDRILHARGRQETMLLGAETLRPALQALDLDIDPEPRERFSQLSYSGPVKLTKLPKRSAIVAFSAEEVYAIAELLRRQRGGAAVVMGALSPRTRNAQVALYQSGEVDYIVATDAIGMGLNMDVGHVAFASRRKFDGHKRRPLRSDEAAQIAGRAGRFRDDGTFGETGDCQPFDEEMVTAIENHRFDPVDKLVWRNSDLDVSSVDALLAALRRAPTHPILRRVSNALDELTLETLARDGETGARATTPRHVERLWSLCTLPDFRKSGPDGHVRLVKSFAEKLIEPDARLKDDWVYGQVARLDNSEGDIDSLQNRLSQIRTWTYAANRDDWLENAKDWRGRTREIEDRLSDALHDRLMQRFVDRRTSALLKSLNSEDDAAVAITKEGEVSVEGHLVGRLEGLSFKPAVTAQTLEGRAVRNAAMKALKPVIDQKLQAIAAAEDRAITLADGCFLLMEEETVARLAKGPNWLSPAVGLVGAEEASPGLRAAAEKRLARWVDAHIAETLAPIYAVRAALDDDSLNGLARGAAHQLIEAGAAVDRRRDETTAALSRADREALKSIGVRTGRIAAYMPGLLKPAQSGLCLALRALFAETKSLQAPGAASFPVEKGWSEEMLSAAGYVRLGRRAVRADMAERLSWSLGQARKASETSAFAPPPELAALIGCPGGEFGDVLRAIGLKPARRDKETGEPDLWRFASKRRENEKAQTQQTKANADSPFAALAALASPVEPAQSKRRRKPKKRRTKQAETSTPPAPTDATQTLASSEPSTVDAAEPSENAE